MLNNDSLQLALSRVGARKRRMMASLHEPAEVPPSRPEAPMSDAQFFAANPQRRFRVRSWERADRPDLDPRDTLLRAPLCSIVVRTPYGPVARYQPASVGDSAIMDTDEAAEALIAVVAREGWRP